METKKEAVLRKYKNSKAVTKHPNKINSFVVAFSLQEPFDFIPKNKTAMKENFVDPLKYTKSISPTKYSNSLKTLSIIPVDRFSYTLDTFSDEKTDILDDYECGDTGKKSLQICYHQGVGIKMADEQPDIICSASENIKRYKDENSLSMKPKKIRRLAACTNVNFKYRNSYNNVTIRKKKHNEWAKMSSPCFSQIRKPHCNKISNGLPQSRMSNVLATVNFLKDRKSYCNVNKFDVNNKRSRTPSPTLSGQTLISCTNRNTLVPQKSSTSISSDCNELSIINSVIDGVYKTDIYENDVNQTNAVPSNDSCVNKERLNDSNINSILDAEAVQAPTNSKISEVLTSVEKKCLVGASSYDDISTIDRRNTMNRSFNDSPFNFLSISETIVCSNLRNDYGKIITANTPNTNISYEAVNQNDITSSTNSNDSSYNEICSEEVTKSMSLSDSSVIWDRLTIVLDSAVQRLQHTLDKEILELKKLLAIFVPNDDKQHKNTTQDVQSKIHEKQIIQQNMFGAEKHTISMADLCLKKDSVENKVDQITLKLDMDKRTQLPISSISLKELKSRKMVNNYIESLELAPHNDMEVGKGDTLTPTSAQLVTEETLGFQRVNQIIQEPLSFVNENRVSAISHKLKLKLKDHPIFRKGNPKPIKSINTLKLFTLPINTIHRNKPDNNHSLNNNINMHKTEKNPLGTLSTTPVQVVSTLSTFINKYIKMNKANDNHSRDADKRKIQKHNLEDDAKKLDGHHKIYQMNTTSFNNLKKYKYCFNNQIMKAKKLERIDLRFQNRKYKKTLKKICGTVEINSRRNQKLHCNGVSKIASTPCVRAKVLAKENLLDDRLSSSAILLRNNNNNNYYLHVPPLLSYKTLINNSSGTLVPRNSSASLADDVNSESVRNDRLQECKTDAYNKLVEAFDSLKQNIDVNVADSRGISPSAELTVQPPVTTSYDDITLIAEKRDKNEASNNLHFETYSSETTMSSVTRDSSDKICAPYVSNGNTKLETVIMLDNILSTTNARSNTESNTGETKEGLPLECLKNNFNNNVSSDKNKMWAGLTLAIGSALKRLRNTFKKEVRDTKINVEIYLQHNDILNDIKTEEIKTEIPEMLQKNVVEVNPISNAVLGLQNDFTENKVQVADQMMLNMDEPATLPSSSLITHRIGKDYIGIVKPHTIEDIEEGKGDRVASVVLVAADEPHRFERLRSWVRTMSVLSRENAVAIASHRRR